MVLLVAAIAMNAFLIFSWWLTTAYSVNEIAMADPQLAKRLEELQKNYSSSEFQQNETEVQRSLEAMTPILVKVDWFKVATFTSVFDFCLIGFFAARWLNSTDWIGALPVLAVISGQNPAILSVALAERGVSGARLSLGQQVSLLAIQMICVCACGYLGLYLKTRKSAQITPDSGQVTSG